MTNLCKKKVLQASICLLSVHVYGQVGINTDTPKSTLEVVGKPAEASVADGIIAPRITGNELFLKNTVYGNDQKGTLIYVTAPATGTSLAGATAEVTESGYYVHNGVKWIRAGGRNWSLAGNKIGTDDFIGTTNDQPIRLKVNGQKAGHISSDNTAIGQYTFADNTTGENNTALGRYTLNDNTEGNSNTAVGVYALAKNTAGSSNTAVGQYTLNDNTAGSNNTAVGQYALSRNTEGNNNIAVGEYSLNTNTKGNKNIAIGYRADVTKNNLTNAIAIGSNAKVSASNSLVLGGKGADAVNVGIGTDKPKAALEITGINGANDDIVINSSDLDYVESGSLQFNKYRTNTAGDSINIHANDVLGEIGFGGYFNGFLQKSANIFAVARDSPTGPLNADLVFSTKAENKMIITSDGNVGIGTSSPTEKLDVRGKLKLVDGTQGKGRILTSDPSGVAKWKYLFLESKIDGTMSWSPNTQIGNSNWNSIGYIDLSPGLYLIYYKVHLLKPSGNAVYMRTFMSTDLLNNHSAGSIAPIVGSSNFISLERDGESFISFYYTNTTDGTVRLYLNFNSDDSSIRRSAYGQNTNWKGVRWDENYIYAIPSSN